MHYENWRTKEQRWASWLASALAPNMSDGRLGLPTWKKLAAHFGMPVEAVVDLDKMPHQDWLDKYAYQAKGWLLTGCPEWGEDAGEDWYEDEPTY